ncbi:hypothetical protein BKA69DRAFT_1084265 [Paraphysoderma sedebokerense]|nr:hypothetical protein BKA69DRAFT_1084265 [Paraphysoderma sedebokerense]
MILLEIEGLLWFVLMAFIVNNRFVNSRECNSPTKWDIQFVVCHLDHYPPYTKSSKISQMVAPSQVNFSALVDEWDDLQRKLVTKNIATISSSMSATSCLMDKFEEFIETSKIRISQM